MCDDSFTNAKMLIQFNGNSINAKLKGGEIYGQL